MGKGSSRLRAKKNNKTQKISRKRYLRGGGGGKSKVQKEAKREGVLRERAKTE